MEHHDLLDPSRKGEEGSRWALRQALGVYGVQSFRGIHHEALTRELAALPLNGGAEISARRGRLLRLLGDLPAARRAFLDSLASAPNARAAGWLGEMSIGDSPRRALEILSRAIRLDSSWPWPRLWRAAALLELGKGAAARAQLDEFSRLGGGRPFILGLLRFQAAMLERDYRRAKAFAEAAIAADPASSAGYEAAARALQALGRDAAAMSRAHDARDRDLDVTGAYLYESRFELDWNDPDALLARLDSAIAARPKVAALYAERAELKRLPRLCRYEEALEDYAKAVALEPRRAWLRAVLGRARNNLHGGRAGLTDFNAAVRLAPGCGWIRAWRGALCARLGESRRALADFSAAQRLMPWYSFTYAWRGALLNRQKDFAAAKRDLDTALRLDPTYTFSVYERFRARRGLKDYPGALSDLNAAFAADPKYAWDGDDRPLDAAVKAHPDLAWLHAWRGFRRLGQGRAAEAVVDLDRALARVPGSALLLAWRGRARYLTGRKAQALADLGRAARLSPGLWAAHQALAEVHESRGEARQALRAISAAARLAPTTVSFLLTKARLELELGRPDAALASTDRALQLDAGSAAARALKARAFLARGMSRAARGRIADFRRALELSPEMFSPEERRTISGAA
jgi:tetratricopeptide (TPR) repeat protein